MRRTRMTLVPLAASAAMLACESTTGPGSVREPAIWTDRPVYVVESGQDWWRAEIPYVFVNRTGRPVQIAHCNRAIDLRLDQWRDTHWVPAWYPVLPLCLSVPIEIAPGEAFQDTVHFYATHDPTSAVHPGLQVDRVTGAYRIVWLGVSYTDEVGGGELPLEFRSSNVFTLRD